MDGGQVITDARGKEDGTLLPRLSKQSHLALPRLAGQFPGRVPTLVAAGWRRDWRRVLHRRNLHSVALCSPPGIAGRGEGVLGRLDPPRSH